MTLTVPPLFIKLTQADLVGGERGDYWLNVTLVVGFRRTGAVTRVDTLEPDLATALAVVETPAEIIRLIADAVMP